MGMDAPYPNECTILLILACVVPACRSCPCFKGKGHTMLRQCTPLAIVYKERDIELHTHTHTHTHYFHLSPA